MIKDFFYEVNSNKYFNLDFNKSMNMSKTGCVIVYLTFLLSIMIYPIYIKITIWITLFAWFCLIIFSTNKFIYEKQIFSDSKYLDKIKNDVIYIKLLLKRYELEEKTETIKLYIKETKLNNGYKMVNWITGILPITVVVILLINVLDVRTKIIYIIIITILTVLMNKYINNFNRGSYTKRQCNYDYLLYCLEKIEYEKSKIS